MSADVNTGTREFILPDLGEGLTEAELISWKVEIGDEVHVDQMVVEVESAKSVVELPCPYAGQVVSLHANAGDTVSAGQALLTVAEAGVEMGAGDEGDGGTPASVSQSGSSTENSSGANLIGYGTSEPKTRSTKKRSFGGKHAAAPAVPTVIPDAPSQPPAETPASPATHRRLRTTVSPRVLATGAQARKGSRHQCQEPARHGPGGVVTRADVMAAIESGAGAAAHVPAGTSPAKASSPAASSDQSDRDTRTPITDCARSCPNA